MNEPKLVMTRSGEKWAIDLKESEELWTLYKSSKPTFLSVRKCGRGWEFAVWGSSALACRNNATTLRQMLRDVKPQRRP